MHYLLGDVIFEWGGKIKSDQSHMYRLLCYFNAQLNFAYPFATRINIGLMIIAGMLLALSRRLIFGGPVIALGLTGKSLSAVK